MACGTPSSSTSKSDAARSVTGLPFLSLTTTSTSTAEVSALNGGCGGSCAATTVAANRTIRSGRAEGTGASSRAGEPQSSTRRDALGRKGSRPLENHVGYAAEACMSQIKGPAIFLAQFMGDEAPFNSLPNITAWAKDLGYKGVQIPSWDAPRHRPQEGRRVEDLLRRPQGPDATASRSPNSPPTCRASSSPSIPPTTRCSTPSPRRKSAATRKPAPSGPSSR